MANRVDCFWGQSGTGKSEGARAFIEQIYKTSGQKSRVIVGDGSKATYIDAGLVDAGVVEIADFSIRPYPLTVMSKLCEGYWPADVDDPNSPLVPPKPGSLKDIGVFVVEGLSVAAQYVMGNQIGGLAEQAARGIKIGQDSPVLSKDGQFNAQGQFIAGSGPKVLDHQGKEVKDVFAYGGNPMAHFGFAQRQLLSYVERTKLFPNYVIWTAHERSTADKISGEKLVGPEGAGEAMTANLPRVFNNTLHFVTASRKKDKKKDEHTDQMVTELDVEYRVYTRDHFHPDGSTFVKYKAVTRGASEAQGMPLYFSNDTPGQSVLEFYQKIADLKQARIAALQNKTA
jgi:hypothetical protein